ncbi:DUF402 domain-containing protein [Abyssisolibacter fermentans]|uniref:DUF402 domain-containing protein n=1 Tax=Abyssisolibacter fermentans TaxID=1766203 RepID=UPI0008362F7C|nr:DUF402 domain-containing protein [Abyssisolibacter fermentans]
MKRKYINGINWKWLDSYSSQFKHIDDIFSGYISLIKVDKVKRKITVDYEQSENCLFDDGYKCLVFLPDNEKWCVSAVYNRSGEIIEWYFDMTKENSIDELGNPFFYDLYLDIAVSSDFKVVILDEDELKEALEAKIITNFDYEMAYETCNKIMKEIIPNRDFLVSFFRKYLISMEH